MTNKKETQVLDRPVADVEGAGCTLLDLELSDLSCGGCARSIERLLADVPGVSHANVRFVNPQASDGKIWFDAGRTSDDEIVRAIEGAGYGVTVRE